MRCSCTPARAGREPVAARDPAAEPGNRGELLRLAAWRASRSGLSDFLLSPLTGLPEPAVAVVDTLLGQVGDALAEAGDTATVRELLAALLVCGNGAAFQRNAYQPRFLPAQMPS
jgi:glutamate---cysteine ligase / carboxylate-amine ligase